MAPQGPINQIGHSLARVIHAFASTSEDEIIFMAKWDINDGFWSLDCAEVEEWNFTYVLPQLSGQCTKLVIPNSRQMGWIESPLYLYVALEKDHDVAVQYSNTSTASCPTHKFTCYTQVSKAYHTLPAKAYTNKAMQYLVDVYVDDYISLVIPTSQEQLDHVANSIMCAIHEIFPPEAAPANDPISFKNLLKLKGAWDTIKEILGFVFDRNSKTMWLAKGKRDELITTIKS